MKDKSSLKNKKKVTFLDNNIDNYDICELNDKLLDTINNYDYIIFNGYIPNKLIIGSKSKNNLPLLKNRYVEGKTLIYVCVNKACKMPTESLEEAISLIKY